MSNSFVSRIFYILTDAEKKQMMELIVGELQPPSLLEPVEELPSFDLECAYRLYPRKIGKDSGLKRLKQKVKSAQMFDRLIQAVANYSLYVKRERIEAKYIMHFSTFAGRFEDWCDENVEQQSGYKKPDTLEVFK